MSERYELLYWPSIQGRGEFVRLSLEEAGADYVDVARRSGGMKALREVLESGDGGLLPYAPPILRHDGFVVAQTAAILMYLGPRLGLVPEDEKSRLAAHQLELTMADLVKEAHDTHHPVGSGLYYEDQKAEAKRYATEFVNQRIPKYLGYFERVLERNTQSDGRHLIGSGLTYVDLSMFQVMVGLGYAFPKAMKKLGARTKRLRALADAVAARPRIAAYLDSDRRIPFNEDGIFRRYPELDIEPAV
jgi:glutathione S-transferase